VNVVEPHLVPALDVVMSARWGTKGRGNTGPRHLHYSSGSAGYRSGNASKIGGSVAYASESEACVCGDRSLECHEMRW